jgi:pyruvate kinase
VLIDDGLISCLVTEVDEFQLKTIVENTGKIGTKKGCNLPGIKVDLPALTDKDVADLEFGVKNGIDFIAASFTRKADDVRAIRKVLGPKGSNIKIISKIENLEGMDNFDEILEESDGIMVARGDLGTEIPLERVVLAQKMMIAKCNLVGKPVITATQMLETMIYNPRPTRAEATDVANAVFDGTDCVMLSGETAKGDYPIHAVERMASICVTTEETLDYGSLFLNIRRAILRKKMKVSVSETIASSAVKTADELEAALIIVLTETGNTARLVSKYKSKTPTLVITQHKQTARQLMCTRGVACRMVDSMIGADSIVKMVIKDETKKGNLNPGDVVVLVFGNVEGVTGQTNNMKVVQIQ